MTAEVDALVPALEQGRQLHELIALPAGQREVELRETCIEDGSRVVQAELSAGGGAASVPRETPRGPVVGCAAAAFPLVRSRPRSRGRHHRAFHVERWGRAGKGGSPARRRPPFQRRSGAIEACGLRSTWNVPGWLERATPRADLRRRPGAVLPPPQERPPEPPPPGDSGPRRCSSTPPRPRRGRRGG